jgi:hypothetical protein
MLRPLPHRGDVVAAGAVALAALVLLLQLRFDTVWATGVHLVYAAAALAFVGALALRAPREGPDPRAYQSALLATTFALAVPALTRLAQVFGSDGLDSSGTLAWVGGALAALSFGLASARSSALCVLLGAVSLVIAVVALVYWAFSPHGVGTARWLLLVLTGGLALGTVAQRDRRPARAVALADAGGLAALALALTFAIEPFTAGIRGPGPGWIGVAVLVTTTFVVAGGATTLLGWPLVLAAGAGALLTIGLRPSRPLPPPPLRDEADVLDIRVER